MSVRPARVSAYAGLGALFVSLLLVIASALRHSPGGAGENIEWLLSYLLLLGFPTSLVVAQLQPLIGRSDAGPMVIRVAMILAVSLNWVLIAYAIAKLISAIRRHAHVPSVGGT